MQIYVIIIVLLIAGGVVGAYFSHRRSQEMIWLAMELELDYDAGKDSAGGRRFGTRESAALMDNSRYAGKTLSGRYRGHRVVAANIHTRHRSFAIFQLDLPGRFPFLSISPERSKLARGPRLEYDDISFESKEFSRKFRIKSNDKKFAYDVCHPRMIEYLLAHHRLMIRVHGDKLTLFTSRRLVPKTVKPNLNRLVEVRELLPDYLFSRR